jgi:CDP-diacylglycerol--glycerol-3-phosphate 3-phosphatidyltransferase
MPSVYDLKPRFQALLRPLAARLARAGVGADAVTSAAALMSILLGALAYTVGGWTLLLYPPVLLLRMALNAIDGMLAREVYGTTRRGAFLNEICDMVSDAALYLPLAILLPAPGALVVLIVALALIGEAAGIEAQALGGTRRYDGPLGKSDRALAFGVLAAAGGLDLSGNAAWMPWALALLVLAAAATVANRVHRALKA